MATTFLLEELDDATRDYLLGVKGAEGRGFPGVYVPVKSSLPAVGCFLGLALVGIMIPVTLLSGIILGDPTGVALLQTAILLVGGWMVVAFLRVRAGRGSPKVAGRWVYADPLHLYEARGEQVKVTPVDEVVEAQFTHNYNNGSYQNSVVRALLPGKAVVSVTVHDERRAERLVVFFNYLGWARGPDGGERADLEPATLGGLARYVAYHENEPLDAEGNVNLDLIELDVDAVPEEPRREGRATPNFLPYVALVLAGLVCFVVMRTINVPQRDEEIYQAVTKPPLEPRVLRAYLVDDRNQRYRKQVTERLAGFYEQDPGPIQHVKTHGADVTLRGGFADVLRSVSKEPQAVVSLRVKETKSPPGAEGEAADREKAVRLGVADRTNEVFAQQSWGAPVAPVGDVVFKEPPPPLGHQFLAYVEAPEEAEQAHFLIEYGFEPAAGAKAGAARYTLRAKVVIRDNVQGNPVGEKTFDLPNKYTSSALDTATKDLIERVINDMIGDPSKRAGVNVPPNAFNPGAPRFPVFDFPK